MQSIETSFDWLLELEQLLCRVRHRFLTFFGLWLTHIASCQNICLKLKSMSGRFRCFDMFSLMYENPQRTRALAAMFRRHGADVSFDDFEHLDGFAAAAVVRGIKRS